jgi:hypothetical protein
MEKKDLEINLTESINKIELLNTQIIEIDEKIGKKNSKKDKLKYQKQKNNLNYILSSEQNFCAGLLNLKSAQLNEGNSKNSFNLL